GITPANVDTAPWTGCHLRFHILLDWCCYHGVVWKRFCHFKPVTTPSFGLILLSLLLAVIVTRGKPRSRGGVVRKEERVALQISTREC
ncbi:mCG1037397, partial [Mus musculus]